MASGRDRRHERRKKGGLVHRMEFRGHLYKHMYNQDTDHSSTICEMYESSYGELNKQRRIDSTKMRYQ